MRPGDRTSTGVPRNAEIVPADPRREADFVPTDDIDQLFGQANPNPSRSACLDNATLVALARRERPMNDPGYVHLRECSPCYMEVRALQEAEKLASRERQAWMLRRSMLAVLLAVILLTILWILR